MRAKSKFTKLLFTPFTVTVANPFKIRFANGICSHLNHFLTDFAVNANSCVNSNFTKQLSTDFSGNLLKHFTFNGIITIQRESTHSKVDAPS